MGIQASAGRRVNPGVKISGESISPVEDDSFKFLGMPIRVYKNNNTAKSSLQENLKRMLNLVDSTPLTSHQKLRLFKEGICPRLSWSLMLEDLSITWLERHLQPLATKALKRWAGLARSANTSILYLPVKRGGLALPCLVNLYKKLQSSRIAQLFTSRGPGVRKAAQLHLLEEKQKERVNFKPAVMIDEILSHEQPRNRQALSRAAKTLIADEDADTRHQHLCHLPAQGEMARLWDENSPEQWVRAVQGLPPEPMKFALNASLDVLPTNNNLFIWKKRLTAAAPSARNQDRAFSMY